MVQLFVYIHVSSNDFIRDQGTFYLHAWSSWLFQTGPVLTLLPFNHVAYEYPVKARVNLTTYIYPLITS